MHIIPLIGAVKLARLSTPMIEAFRKSMLEKSTPSLTRDVLISLKGILSEAQRKGLVAQNVALPVRVEVSKRGRKLIVGRDIPSKEEIQTILAKADGSGARYL